MKIISIDKKLNSDMVEMLKEILAKAEAGEYMGFHAHVVSKDNDSFIYGAGLENQTILWMLVKSARHIMESDE